MTVGVFKSLVPSPVYYWPPAWGLRHELSADDAPAPHLLALILPSGTLTL